jgi:hypothetical protein
MVLCLAGSRLPLCAAVYPVALREAEPRLPGARQGWFELLRVPAGTEQEIRFTPGRGMPVSMATTVTGALLWSLRPAGGVASAFAALPAGKSWPVAGGNAGVAGEWAFVLRNESAVERFCSIGILTGAAMDQGAGTSRAAAQDLMPSLSQPLVLQRLGAAGTLTAGTNDWWKFTMAAETRVTVHLSGPETARQEVTNAAGAVLPVDAFGTLLPAGDYWIQVSGPAGAYGLSVLLNARNFGGSLAFPVYAPPGCEEPTVAAFIADYGDNSINEANVARMIRHWNPHCIMAGGDNTYVQAAETAVGSPAWSRNIGAYYGEFIMGRADRKYPEQISPVQRFFPAVGNHDTDITEAGGGSIAGYLDYFHHNPGGTPRLPADSGALHHDGESYYRVRQGPVEWIVMDGDHARFSTTLMEKQKDWVRASLAASDAPWRFVVEHYPPWCSASFGRGTEFRWLETADTQAVFTGDVHVYERLQTAGPLAIVCGVSGATRGAFGGSIPESRFRYAEAHGAVKISATRTHADIRFQDINDGASGGNGGRLVDAHTLSSGQPVGEALLHETSFSTEGPVVIATLTPPDSTVDLKLSALSEGLDVNFSDDNSAPDGRNARLLVSMPNFVFYLHVERQTAAPGAGEVVMLTPYEAWRMDYLPGISDTAAAPAANADGDSFPNLVEFAMGTDPLKFTPAPDWQRQPDGTLSLRFQQLADAAARGITLTAELSPDLQRWLPADADLTPLFGPGFAVTKSARAFTGNDSLLTREVRLPATAPRCWLRLRGRLE